MVLSELRGVLFICVTPQQIQVCQAQGKGVPRAGGHCGVLQAPPSPTWAVHGPGPDTERVWL